MFDMDFGPKIIEKYKTSSLICRNEDQFYRIMSGETRNIIRDFYKGEKDAIGKCQYRNCKHVGVLHTSHLKEDRPYIFKTCAKNNRKSFGGLYKYDIYFTFKEYLEKHKAKKSVIFLCSKHHNILDNVKMNSKRQLKEFLKNVVY
jgi:hypothetical protein